MSRPLDPRVAIAAPWAPLAPWVLMVLMVLVVACGEGQPAPGDPTRFDPIARYQEVAEFAGGGLELRQLSAKGVREDGTVDLEEKRYPTGVEYHFARSVPAPADAPPVGGGGAAKWQKRVTVALSKAGDNGEETDQHGTRRVMSKGMRRIESEPEPEPVRADPPLPLPAPACSFAELWKHALEAGAPPGSVAHVDYMDGRYRFRVSDVGFGLELGQDCAPLED